jgi:hypothetical protein
MQLLTFYFLALSPAQFPGSAYDGPAYTQCVGTARSPIRWLVGQRLRVCVLAGAKPEFIERLFGPPLLTCMFRSSPVECLYVNLGVTAYFPQKAFPPVRNAVRVHGRLQ